MKKIAYIIPGYCESHARQRGYDKVAKFFEDNGIEPIHMEIDWAKKKPEKFSYYTEEFLKAYKKPRNTKVYILGFSYGATIAFLTASKTKPDALILCSLSPYFEEDLKTLKKSWVKWFRQHFIESDYSFKKTAPKIKSPTHLIVGDKEDKACIIRAKDAKRNIANSKLSIAKNAKHKIGQKEYLAAIEKIISKL